MAEVSDEAEFHEAMLDIYRVGVQHGYRATGFMHLIVMKNGGLPAARHMLSTGTVAQSGLDRLWEMGLMEHSMEALALQHRFQRLFNHRERAIAQQRLQERGFFVAD